MWQTVAEGKSFWELKALVADMQLSKGSKMKVIMDTAVPWLFDMAGAELAFKPLVPAGMILKDVYGEGEKGIVEMEADPAWLLPVLIFIKAHWLTIIIAGFVLTVIVSFIRIMIEIIKAPTPIPAALVLVGIVLLAMMVMRKPDTYEGSTIWRR